MPNDFISREAILAKQYEAEGHCGLSRKVVDVRDIEDEPASDVAPAVHGAWISADWYETCSCCGASFDGASWFCPNCGAKMDGGEHHAD